MLTEIITCKRRPSKSVDVFFNCYKACIARYINQSTVSSHGKDNQWAIMLLRNVMLSPDRLNSFTFQPTNGATTTSLQYNTITIDAETVQEVMIFIANSTE